MDNEIKGEGSSYTTYFRQYDPRVARWLSIDPVTFHSESPYMAMNNNPILYNDVKGDCPPCLAALAWLASLEGAVVTGGVITTVGIYQQRDNIRNGARGLMSLASYYITTPELTSLVPGGFTPNDSPELEVETFPAVSEALRQEIMEQVLPVQDNVPAFRGGMDRIPLELAAPSIETIPEFNDNNFSNTILNASYGGYVGGVPTHLGEFTINETGFFEGEFVKNGREIVLQGEVTINPDENSISITGIEIFDAKDKYKKSAQNLVGPTAFKQLIRDLEGFGESLGFDLLNLGFYRDRPEGSELPDSDDRIISRPLKKN